MQIFQRQRQILRKRTVVRHNSQHFAACAVRSQPAVAKLANRTKAERAASDVDFPNHTLSNPALFRLRTYPADFFDLANKLMSRRSVKIVIPAQNFHVGVANSRHTHAHQRPASPQFRQGFAGFNQLSVLCLKRDQRRAIASASASATSCSANTVRRSRMTESSSTRAITSVPT